MNWRDLLYFSKGERRALTLLLSLIVISWLILWFTDREYHPSNGKAPTVTDTIIGKRDTLAKNNIPSPTTNTTVRRKEKEPRRTEPKKTYTNKSFHQTEKYPVGTVVELNSADTTILKKVPGIGSTFARRIVKYRELIGGYVSVQQLTEVYGIDEERYEALKPWFIADSTSIRKLNVNQAPIRDLYRHPYINSQQARAINQLRRQKGRLTGWENLQLLEEFSEADRERLTPYLSFE